MSQTPRPPQGPRSLAGAAGRLLKPAFRKRGFARGDVLTRWPDIVGADLAKVAAPERLQFGQNAGPASLTVRVAPGFGPALQHLEPLVIERINTFYGYRAVGRLKLMQAPLKSAVAKEKPKSAASLAPAEAERLAAILQAIADPELRAALERLGRELLLRRTTAR